MRYNNTFIFRGPATPISVEMCFSLLKNMMWVDRIFIEGNIGAYFSVYYNTSACSDIKVFEESSNQGVTAHSAVLSFFPSKTISLTRFIIIPKLLILRSNN